MAALDWCQKPLPRPQAPQRRDVLDLEGLTEEEAEARQQASE